MDALVRLAVVVALVAAIALVNRWYRRRRTADGALGATDEAGEDRWPALPRELRGPSATWIIFTTPLCVSCGAVEADLVREFPHHTVRRVDATERPDLADRYEVRRAPTTVVADATGRIVERLVGPESVRAFIGTADDPALRS